MWGRQRDSQAALLIFIMKKAFIVLLTTWLLGAPFTAFGQGEAAGKRSKPTPNRRPFVPLDFKKMFTAGLLSDPQPPSTLLPAGKTTVLLTLRAAEPTLCRYSVGQDRPLEQMTAFDTRQPSSSPRTIVRGLDPNPNKINDVYIRCAAAPETPAVLVAASPMEGRRSRTRTAP